MKTEVFLSPRLPTASAGWFPAANLPRCGIALGRLGYVPQALSASAETSPCFLSKPRVLVAVSPGCDSQRFPTPCGIQLPSAMP